MHFAQHCASNCKLHLILAILGLSRASLGASFGAFGRGLALQIRSFCCRALVKTRFAQEFASNCKLNLTLAILGLSCGSLLEPSSGALGSCFPLQIRKSLLQSLAFSALCAGWLSAFEQLGWLDVAGYGWLWLAGWWMGVWMGGWVGVMGRGGAGVG